MKRKRCFRFLQKPITFTRRFCTTEPQNILVGRWTFILLKHYGPAQRNPTCFVVDTQTNRLVPVVRLVLYASGVLREKNQQAVLTRVVVGVRFVSIRPVQTDRQCSLKKIKKTISPCTLFFFNPSVQPSSRSELGWRATSSGS